MFCLRNKCPSIFHSSLPNKKCLLSDSGRNRTGEKLANCRKDLKNQTNNPMCRNVQLHKSACHVIRFIAHICTRAQRGCLDCNNNKKSSQDLEIVYTRGQKMSGQQKIVTQRDIPLLYGMAGVALRARRHTQLTTMPFIYHLCFLILLNLATYW